MQIAARANDFWCAANEPLYFGADVSFDSHWALLVIIRAQMSFASRRQKVSYNTLLSLSIAPLVVPHRPKWHTNGKNKFGNNINDAPATHTLTHNIIYAAQHQSQLSEPRPNSTRENDLRKCERKVIDQ